MNADKAADSGDLQQELTQLKLRLAEQFMDMERLKAHISAANREPTNIETMKLADFHAAVDEARDRIVALERTTS
jgi:hypothetical protein